MVKLNIGFMINVKKELMIKVLKKKCFLILLILNYNEIFCYLNNIGEIFLYPDIKFNQDLNCLKNKSGKKNKYKGIFSIIFISKKASCKSTLINILLKLN